MEDSHTRQMPINGWVPTQRGESSAATVPAHDGPAHAAPSYGSPTRGAHAATVPAATVPASPTSPAPASSASTAPAHAWPTRDETMLLPAFLTAPRGVELEVAEKPAAPATPPDDRLPSTERNMLIFVSLLLAVGTLAIVAMASIGR